MHYVQVLLGAGVCNPGAILHFEEDIIMKQGKIQMAVCETWLTGLLYKVTAKKRGIYYIVIISCVYFDIIIDLHYEFNIKNDMKYDGDCMNYYRIWLQDDK